MRPRVLAEAEAELLDAILWYEDRSKGLGEEFYECFLASLEAIGKNPLRFPTYEGTEDTRQLRRALLEKFPYVIVYEVCDDFVLIVAVAHTARQPEYWRNR